MHGLYWHELVPIILLKRLMGYSVIFQAAVRLADILHQVNGKHTEAGQYFQEALDWLPFIHADADFIFSFEEFAVGHLMSINNETSLYITLLKHCGQWAELEMSRPVCAVRCILDLPYNPPVLSSTGLTDTDFSSSLDHILGIGSTAVSKFLYSIYMFTCRLAFFYATSIFILLAILIVSIVLLILVCMYCIP